MLDAAMSRRKPGVGVSPVRSRFPMILSTHRSDKVLIFYCALARQCFINEYIFGLIPTEEFDQAQALRDRLAAAVASGLPVPPVWLPAVAAYFPLISLTARNAPCRGAAGSLLARCRESALLVQQVHEPLEERRYRSLIPSLTPIADDISRAVQKQYEENPYPRWVKLPPGGKGVTIDTYLRSQFPLSEFKPMDACVRRTAASTS